MTTLARYYVELGGGYFRLNRATFEQIPNSKGLVSSMEDAIRRTASKASALANETYHVTTRRGRFRTYVEARGQEPPSAGYWRGKRVMALWSSRPVIRDTGSR